MAAVDKTTRDRSAVYTTAPKTPLRGSAQFKLEQLSKSAEGVGGISSPRSAREEAISKMIESVAGKPLENAIKKLCYPGTIDSYTKDGRLEVKKDEDGEEFYVLNVSDSFESGTCIHIVNCLNLEATVQIFNPQGLFKKWIVKQEDDLFFSSFSLDENEMGESPTYKHLLKIFEECHSAYFWSK